MVFWSSLVVFGLCLVSLVRFGIFGVLVKFGILVCLVRFGIFGVLVKFGSFWSFGQCLVLFGQFWLVFRLVW